ncbi:uncharacterized protein LOC143296579 [Babylonia areolata]|uniref:uncharacterized protein LOC143296579 n=1 Tax=Babylonia areolata TaxID=304850 RepID=UPI003FD36966
MSWSIAMHHCHIKGISIGILLMTTLVLAYVLSHNYGTPPLPLPSPAFGARHGESMFQRNRQTAGSTFQHYSAQVWRDQLASSSKQKHAESSFIDGFSKSGSWEEINETSSTEVTAWVSEAEGTGSTFGQHQAAGWRDGNASCYPRLFAMMPAASSKAGRASAMSGCRDGHGANGGRGSNPVRHVFFLKTHKTGSQTMTGILNRYALVHNLSVAIRKVLNGHNASSIKNWIPDIRPLLPGIPHYDMITDHVRFNEICVRHFLPDDAVFISIVREPLDKFVSAFYFYNMERRIPRLRSRNGEFFCLFFLFLFFFVLFFLFCFFVCLFVLFCCWVFVVFLCFLFVFSP